MFWVSNQVPSKKPINIPVTYTIIEKQSRIHKNTLASEARSKKVKVEQSPPWLNITHYQMHLKKAGQYSQPCSVCYSVYCTKNGYGCASVIVSDCRRGRRTAHGCSVQTSSPHALQSTSAMTLILKWVFWNCFFFLFQTLNWSCIDENCFLMNILRCMYKSSLKDFS